MEKARTDRNFGKVIQKMQLRMLEMNKTTRKLQRLQVLANKKPSLNPKLRFTHKITRLTFRTVHELLDVRKVTQRVFSCKVTQGIIPGMMSSTA